MEPSNIAVLIECHRRGCLCSHFLEENDVTVLDWRAVEPHPNPSENLWGRLSDRLQQLINPPQTERQLWPALTVAGAAVPQGGIWTLCQCRRITAVPTHLLLIMKDVSPEKSMVLMFPVLS